MKEDMISNAFVLLMSRLINFVAAGEMFHPVPAGHRGDMAYKDDPSLFGISQQALLDKWGEIDNEINIWFKGLPETFSPCARLEPSRLTAVDVEPGSPVFSEIWYNIPMCGSTMQNYHMARILLLINKPHESTARRSTVASRLKSYRLIDTEIIHHCHEIW